MRVIHAASGQEETLDLLTLLTSAQQKDIWLMPGDAIVVPRLDHPMAPELFKLVSRSTFFNDTFPVLVLGQVEQQGEIAMKPDHATVNAAIAMAGGFKRLAEKSKIVIQRPTNNGGFSQIEVNRNQVNMDVQPGDIVYVADSKSGSLREIFKTINMLAQPFFFSAAGINTTQDIGN